MSDLQRLLDEQAISEVLILYCRACDRADEALLRSCFHPDSVHRHGGFAGTSANFCTLAMRIIGAASVTRHVLSNVAIELDGNVAQSESYYAAYHRLIDAKSGTAEDNFSAGRYLDRLERREGVWRIAERVGLIDYERFVPTAERSIMALPARARTHRHPEDELYATLAAFRAEADR